MALELMEGGVSVCVCVCVQECVGRRRNLGWGMNPQASQVLDLKLTGDM